MKTHSIISHLKTITAKHPLKTLTYAAAGMLMASTYIYLTPSQYESTTSIEYINPHDERASNSLISYGNTAATEELTSSIFVAKALTGIVDPVSYFVTQDFQTRNNSYGFPYTIKHTMVSDKFNEQAYTVKPIDNNSYQLSSNIHGITRTKTGKFDEELIDQDLALTISKKKTTPYQTSELIQPATYSFKIQSSEALAQSLLMKENGVEVSESNGVVTITCRHESPKAAQQITTALATNFLATRNSFSSNKNEQTATIDEQLTALSTQLEATETQISNFKSANSITDMDIDAEKTLDQLKDLQMQKSQLELNLAALNNTSDYLRKNREINNSNVEYGTIIDPAFSEQIAQLNSKYEAKESGKSTTTTDVEIEALKVSIAERILNTRKKTTVQINKLKHEIAAINTQLATLPEKANTLNSLDRKLALDKKVYDLLAERRAQAMVTGGGLFSNGRILKPASSPTAPVYPTTWLMLAAGLLAGLIISIPLNTIAQKIQSEKLASRQEIDKQSRIPFMGSISQLNTSHIDVESSISDLCTRVLLRQETKMITFASSNRGEGKSFISTHVAQAFAAMDKKVLVIDMNASLPMIAKHFNVTPERSLADVLAGTCDIHDAISITSYPNLDVLQCGHLNSGVNTLLASNKRTGIIDSLKKHYDIIVTDTPDIGTQIDAIPLMKMSDLNLFIVNANTTRKQSLVAAEQIKKDYELQNFYFLLNSVKQTNNQQTGTNRRSRVRNLNKPNSEPKTAYVPTMLRKIALWFY